jgi:hypothetical protein
MEGKALTQLALFVIVLFIILFIISPLAGILVISGIILWLVLKKKITDSEIDQACIDAIQNIKNEAINRLGVDEDQVKMAEPILIKGYDFFDDSSDILYKQGKDGIWRSSQYKAVLFFFSSEQVFCFSRTFSLIKRDEQYDSTDEYFYRDIVSVSTTQNKRRITINEKVDGKKTPVTSEVTSECFRLTTSGGTSVQATVTKKDTEAVNRSINAMRNLLKDKKQIMK